MWYYITCTITQNIRIIFELYRFVVVLCVPVFLFVIFPLFYSLFFSFVRLLSFTHTHAHTHTDTNIYIYILIFSEAFTVVVASLSLQVQKVNWVPHLNVLPQCYIIPLNVQIKSMWIFHANMVCISFWMMKNIMP